MTQSQCISILGRCAVGVHTHQPLEDIDHVLQTNEHATLTKEDAQAK